MRSRLVFMVASVLVWGLARPASAGCCQVSASDSAAITHNMQTCQRKASIAKKGLGTAWTDAEWAQCKADTANVGCCKLGPPGQCNWRRDCCNLGTGGHWNEEAEFGTALCETYEWSSSAWSTCPRCGVANITRSIQCVKVSTQQLVSTAKCQALAGSVPENVTECTGTSGCGYGNVAGPWLPCSQLCGSGVQARKVNCQRSDALVVPRELCRERGLEDVAAERACFSIAGCTYSLVTSAWSECQVDCFKVRSVTCTRSDGTASSEIAAFCSLLETPVLRENCCI